MAILRRLAKFGQNRSAEIWRFFDFPRWPPPPSWIYKFWNFNGRNAQDGRAASSCQIWSKSVKLRPRYGDFSIFQAGGRHHLGFFKFPIFNGRTAQEGRNASPCQICSKSVGTRPRYGDFSIFQDGGRPPSWICCVFGPHTKGIWRSLSLCNNLVGIDAAVW